MENKAIYDFDDFTDFLGWRFEQRKSKNSAYSMRAFARDLSISPSQLCEVLKGHYGISSKAASRVSQALELSIEEENYFKNLVQSKTGKSQKKKDLARIRLSRFRSTQIIDLDIFKAVSEWFHYGILELTYLDDFQEDPQWIAAALAITADQAEEALGRLIKLGFLDYSTGKLACTYAFRDTPNDIPSAALKSFHTSLIQKASQSIESDVGANREIRSVVMSFNKEHLKEAKRSIREFADQFAAKYSNGEGRNSVYCLAMQYYELTGKN